MESEFRLFRSSDSLRIAERQHQSYLCDTWCRPAQFELFLDIAAVDGYDSATDNWHSVRQDMVSFRPSYSLSIYRRDYSSGSDDTSA